MTEGQQRVHLFLLAVIVIFAIVLVVVFVSGSDDIPDLAGPTQYDFGRVEVGPDRDVLQHAYVLKNESSQWIRIEGFTSGCSCTEAEASEYTVAPDEEVSVLATIKPGRRSGEQSVPILMRLSWLENPTRTNLGTKTLRVKLNTRRTPSLWSNYSAMELQQELGELKFEVFVEEQKIGSGTVPEPLTVVAPEDLSVEIEPWKMKFKEVASIERPSLFASMVTITPNKNAELLPETIPIVFHSGDQTYTFTVWTVPFDLDESVDEAPTELIVPIRQTVPQLPQINLSDLNDPEDDDEQEPGDP